MSLTRLGVGGPMAAYLGFADKVESDVGIPELDFLLEVMLADGSSPPVWTDISGDVELEGGLSFQRGVQRNGPADVIAGGGSLRFTLDNSARNAGATQGWYSPNHASRRSGWTFDIPVRLTFTYGITDRIHFRGTIRHIDPEPGIYGAQRVRVEAYDLMRDLYDMDLREIDVATDQSEDDVIDAVLDLLPAEAQPDTRDLDAGVDSYPYVFDRIGAGTKMAAAIADAAISSFGLFFVDGEGTPVFRNRHSRATVSSVYDFTVLRDVAIPSTIDRVYRVVRTVVHPKTIDPAATSVLYSLEGTPPMIGAGATLTIWGEYRDTTDNRSLIGGIDRVSPIVATTDYQANLLEDGTGTDMTGSISVTTYDWATTAKFEITNASAQSVYLTHLQIRGKRVLDIGAQALQSGSDSSLRPRQIEIDLPLQADPYVGQSAADYVRALYGESRRHIDAIEFMPNYSTELMQQFLALEIGDAITVTEDVTGLNEVVAVIQSIDVRVGDAMTLICRYGLAPGQTQRFWQWGIVGASEWGETTIYAF